MNTPTPSNSAKTFFSSGPSALEEARRLFAEGEDVSAIQHARDAADAGDVEAAHEVAKWFFLGRHVPRDLPSADHYLSIAAARNVEAARLRIQLQNNETLPSPGAEPLRRALASLAQRDAYASVQLSMLQHVGEAKVPTAEAVHRDPNISLVRGLLSEQECRYLITLADPNMRPSLIEDATGERRPDPIRTSFSSSFGPFEEDFIVRAINERLAALTRTRTRQGEPLHMLRYAAGQEYKPHVDAIPGLRNQRCYTVILYLNDTYRGGETEFDQLGVSIRGRIGDALVFHNLRPNGASDNRTRHAGLPVTEGVKWVATRWIRQSPHHVWWDKEPSGPPAEGQPS